MSKEIGRSLGEIDSKVKALNATLRVSADNTRELDKALKLNPKDIETAEKKMAALKNTVGTATQKLALLKQKQAEAMQIIANGGKISENEYKKIETAVLRAENEVARLNKELKETQKIKVNQVGASFDKLTGNLKKAQGVMQSMSKVAMGLLTSLAAAATAFVMVGAELDTVSKKFKISAEQLQYERNLYQKATGSADNFDSALQSLNNAMTSIAKGKGSSYLAVLEKLGVSTIDNEGKTKQLTQVYGEIMSALAGVADETDRAAMASIIFGSNGLSVAQVAELGKEQISEYNAELKETGIISSESAAAARDVANDINSLKNQLSQASAEIMVALLPTIKTLVEFLQTTVIPIINTIAGWFKNMTPEQQKLIFFILILIVFLPKLISIVTAIVGVIKAITIASYGAAGGVGAVSAASTPLLPIIWAVAAAILVLVLLFMMLSGKSKDVTKELKSQQSQLSSMQNTYGDLNADMSLTTGTISETTNTTKTTTEINVNITAEGETFLSQESADKVAASLADRINRDLGGKI